MTVHALSRRPRRAAPVITPAPPVALAAGRLHELCGPARQSCALWIAGALEGPVLWIAPAWADTRTNPCGMVQWADPGRFLFAAPKRPDDILWCMEEALRSGATPLVVAELPDPPGLTPVRRLHLAAGTAAQAPLGLILTPGDGGAPGVESRWHMAPAHEGEARRWRLERRRARALPPRSWVLHERDGKHDLVPAGPEG